MCLLRCAAAYCAKGPLTYPGIFGEAAGWLRAVAHLRLPQFWTSPTMASRFRDYSLAAQPYTL